MECGKKGKKKRTRTVLAEAKYGGLECPKNLNETRVCFKNCKNESNGINMVDCEVGTWSAWSECKQGQRCDDGFQERQRSVKRRNLNGGKECMPLRESRKCFLNLCDLKNQEN